MKACEKTEEKRLKASLFTHFRRKGNYFQPFVQYFRHIFLCYADFSPFLADGSRRHDRKSRSTAGRGFFHLVTSAIPSKLAIFAAENS